MQALPGSYRFSDATRLQQKRHCGKRNKDSEEKRDGLWRVLKGTVTLGNKQETGWENLKQLAEILLFLSTQQGNLNMLFSTAILIS